MAHREKPLQFVKVKGNMAQSGAPTSFFGGGYGPLGANAENTKYVTENLSFPLNVEGDPQEGHYIIFTIKEQNKAKLATVPRRQDMTTLPPGPRSVNAWGVGHDPSADQERKRQADAKAAADKLHIMGLTAQSLEYLQNNPDRGLDNSIQLSKNATTDLKGFISLYMPPSVSVSYASKYADTDIGVLADTVGGAISALSGDETDDQSWLGDTAEALGTAAKGTWQYAKNATIGAADIFAPGAKALVAIGRGRITTPRMELMFEGIGRREFSYEFTMIPKSEKEADHIEGIVTKFKHAMAANYMTTDDLWGTELSTGREMDIPSFFDIEYMYKTNKNDHLNKISTCVLSKMDVEYGAERFKTYAGGVPQTTKITLNFAELNIITKKHIELGY